MSPPVTTATCMRLPVVRETNKKLAKSEIRWDGFIYANPEMTIAIEDHLVVQIAATAVAENLTIRL